MCFFNTILVELILKIRAIDIFLKCTNREIGWMNIKFTVVVIFLTFLESPARNNPNNTTNQGWNFRGKNQDEQALFHTSRLLQPNRFHWLHFSRKNEIFHIEDILIFSLSINKLNNWNRRYFNDSFIFKTENAAWKFRYPC